MFLWNFSWSELRSVPAVSCSRQLLIALSSGDSISVLRPGLALWPHQFFQALLSDKSSMAARPHDLSRGCVVLCGRFIGPDPEPVGGSYNGWTTIQWLTLMPSTYKIRRPRFVIGIQPVIWFYHTLMPSHRVTVDSRINPARMNTRGVTALDFVRRGHPFRSS